MKALVLHSGGLDYHDERLQPRRENGGHPCERCPRRPDERRATRGAVGNLRHWCLASNTILLTLNNNQGTQDNHTLGFINWLN